MAYSNIWDATTPLGAAASNTIDDIFRAVKTDIQERFIDIFAMPSFATDPLRPYGIKFTSAQDAVVNYGAARNIIFKDSTGATTYFTFGSTALTLGTGVNLLFPGTISSTGVVRLANNTALGWRNAINNANFTFALNASNVFAVDSDFQVPATKKLYVDGGGDTYLIETSANILDFFVGAGNVFRLSNGAGLVSVLAVDFAIPATKKLYLDAGGNTYFIETSADQIDVFAGAVNVGRFTTTAYTVFGDVKLGTAGNGLYVKEGANATMGTATLNGTAGVTISTTKVTASSRIFVSRISPAGTIGHISCAAVDVIAGTQFIIKASSADTSTVAWIIVEPA